MTTVVISQPMFFPWPGFFEQWMLADIYLWLDDAKFSKGSFTNRIQIKHGSMRKWMSIPLAGKGSSQQIAALEPAEPFAERHLAFLRQAMQGAPHVDDAIALATEVYATRSLCALLMESVEKPAAWLSLPRPGRIERTSAMDTPGTSSQRVLDLVLAVGGTRYITGHGAAGYLDHGAFEAAGVSVEYMAYSLTPWPQKHGEFTPYVSILDLIANTGRGGVDFLRPATLGWREFLATHGRRHGGHTPLTA
jgi:hypothetical protein